MGGTLPCSIQKHIFALLHQNENSHHMWALEDTTESHGNRQGARQV